MKALQAFIFILCIPAFLLLLLIGSAVAVLDVVVESFDGSPTRRGGA